MAATYDQRWDLDAIFPGGIDSPQFSEHLSRLHTNIAQFRDRLEAEIRGEATVDTLVHLIGSLQDLGMRLREAGAFVRCYMAANARDPKAPIRGGDIRQVEAQLDSARTLFDKLILSVSKSTWETLLSRPEVAPIAQPLEERRQRAQERMSQENEALAGDLAVDGYHAWGEFYNTIVGRIAVPFEHNGKTENLSAGQLANKLTSPDHRVRTAAGVKWEEAWGEQAQLCAAALNHLAGFRLNLYRHRGWESVLQEPLENNRMTRATLDTMWSVIDQHKAPLKAYLERKAKVMGLEQLSWHDVAAPLFKSVKAVNYDEAAAFIIEQFGRFNPDMADFTAKAFADRWIEAEDRPGKRPGGFCSSFPLSHQSRIFMTYAGTSSNLSTLAHELGHAYHQHVMNDLPWLAQGYAMNVAETASTFAEMLVSDAALQQAESKEERLAILDEKLERAVAFFMNIHARFIFEANFYEERWKGLLTVDRLSTLMESAQRQAFGDALKEYHPLFWASKLHFYATAQPFYNFPYTFGYLFSAGVYAKAMAEGPSFRQKYVDLLRDTGRMTVEALAARHLGVDLTQPTFWADACRLVTRDVDEFLSLTQA